MPHAIVKSINSYEDKQDLDTFVRDALHLNEAVASFLAQRNPDRLVVVKPNWIQQGRDNAPEVWHPLITHPALVLAVIEGLAEAMGGQGTLAVCDAPHTYADFEAILARGDFRNHFEAWQKRWPEMHFELIDLRREIWVTRDDVVVSRHAAPDDPRGYAQLDLGRDSLFFNHPGEGRYYGADYDTEEVRRHHCGERQEYLLAGTPVACDLFVNIPKIKTHKKTGITCSLKNLVGINGNKNWLPHHTEGTPEDGGDEFPTPTAGTGLESLLKRWGRRAALSIPGVGSWLFRQMRRAGKKVLGDSEATIRNGNWYGNNTCWRMVLDLNRALLYGNLDGTWREASQPKHYLTLVDGIIAGEGNGPVAPDPVAAGVVLAAADPAVADAVTSQLMGYRMQDIPLVRHAFDTTHRWPLTAVSPAEIRIRDDRSACECALDELPPAVPGGFVPHFGWKILRQRHANED